MNVPLNYVNHLRWKKNFDKDLWIFGFNLLQTSSRLHYCSTETEGGEHLFLEPTENSSF